MAALAWILQKFQEFTASGDPALEVLDREALLSSVSLYWLTGTFASSSWPYYERGDGPLWPEGQQLVPTGVYRGPPGIRRLAQRHNTITHWPEGNPGRHHFVAMEVPEQVAADLRVFFAGLG